MQPLRTEVWIEHAERVDMSWCLGVLVKIKSPFWMSDIYGRPSLSAHLQQVLVFKFCDGNCVRNVSPLVCTRKVKDTGMFPTSS